MLRPLEILCGAISVIFQQKIKPLSLSVTLMRQIQKNEIFSNSKMWSLIESMEL